MSVVNQSGEEQAAAPEQVECPLCMEPLEVDDLHFYPCTCGYQICRFCWNRIREIENGLCPACRKAYPENPADFTPLSQEQVAAIKTEKKAREQKRRNKTLESRRALANVRVVQNNLVFVVGLPVRLADPEILKRQEYFGKYGKIHKVVINQSNTYAGSQGPSASAYVTYVSGADALRAIQGVNNVALDGRVLKGSLGTTKYCANFMKNTPCPKPDCMYLHDLGDPKASFTKEEMHAGLHQVYERKLHQALLAATAAEKAAGNSTPNGEKASSKEGNQSNFIPTTVVTSSHINVVNSSRSKKDSVNNGSNSNGGSSSSSSSASSSNGSSSNGSNSNVSSSNGSSKNGSSSNGRSNGNSNESNKDAWPSLGSSPPRASPKLTAIVKSQEQNGQSASESSSPTQQPPQPQPTQPKQPTEAQPKRKEKKIAQKTKEKKPSINNCEVEEKPTSSVFETQSYINNDLDELESDRHSLLEKHDLLDSSSHSLLDDDSHSLLNEVNNEVFQRHREFDHVPLVKPVANGFGLMERDLYMNSDRMMTQGLLEKEMMLRERSRSELMMRQNEMARQRGAMLEKHYMPAASIAMDSANDLLGSNYHPNHNVLPPFGMRVDNSLSNSLANTMSNMNNSMGNHAGVNSITSSMGSHMAGNTLGNINTLGNMGGNMSNTINMSGNSLNMSGNSLNMSGSSLNMGNSLNMSGNTLNMAGNNHMANPLGNPMNMQSSMSNMPSMNNMQGSMNSMQGSMNNMHSSMNNMQSPMNNMPSSMSPFMMHNQQMMLNQQRHAGLANGFDGPQNNSEGRYLAENMDKFFTDFRQAQQMRLMLGRGEERRGAGAGAGAGGQSSRAGAAGAAGGDADDDLDFDPFKETQKALAELMETETRQGGLRAGESERSARLVPPGFAAVPARLVPPPQGLPPGFSAHGSHSAHAGGHAAHAAHAAHGAHVFSDWTAMDPAIVATSRERLQQLQLNSNKLGGGAGSLWAGGASSPGKLWAAGRVPLPPGFAPQPSECIDAK